MLCRAAREHLALARLGGLPRQLLHGAHEPVVAHNLVQLGIRTPKVGLSSIHDHDIEEFLPAIAKRARHHGLRVAKVAVRDQHQRLARLPLVDQRLGQLGVGAHEPRRVGHNLLLQGTLHVRVKHGLLDEHVQPLVRLRTHGPLDRPTVEPVHELRVQHRLAHAEERVEKHPTLILQIHQLAPVPHPHLGRSHPRRPMHRSLDKAKAIRFHNVAMPFVDNQPPNHKVLINLQPLGRHAAPRQRPQGKVVRPAFPRVHIIVDQRVVHVQSNRLNRPEVQRSGAENGTLRLATGIRCVLPPHVDTQALQQRRATAFQLIVLHLGDLVDRRRRQAEAPRLVAVLVPPQGQVAGRQLPEDVNSCILIVDDVDGIGRGVVGISRGVVGIGRGVDGPSSSCGVQDHHTPGPTDARSSQRRPTRPCQRQRRRRRRRDNRTHCMVGFAAQTPGARQVGVREQPSGLGTTFFSELFGTTPSIPSIPSTPSIPSIPPVPYQAAGNSRVAVAQALRCS